MADHTAKQQAIVQDSEEAAPRARVARALCVCNACATRAQCAFRAEILMEEAREKHKRKAENGKYGKNRMNLHKRRRASVQKRDKNGKIWEIRRRHDKGWAEVARDHADGIELGADEIGTAQFSARSARNQAVPRRNR